MKKSKGNSGGYREPKRLSFREEEASQPWLSMLLDAYYIVDKGISEALRIEAKAGKRLACSKGCSNCCETHTTIPVYPLELVGISWFVTEKIWGTERGRLKDALRSHREDDSCPFLCDGVCLIHPIRPVACRQFMVFGHPCSKGEDPYYTRREDVLSPIKKYTDRAFFIMLPFYGIESEGARWKLIEEGAVHQVVKLMQTCRWKSLAGKMEEFEKGITEKSG